ncbi:preprotein translocase subunit SecG, partial [Staphylococcus aureus]
RGAADFLTRATSILGGLFIALSILLAVLAAQGRVAKVVAPTTPPPAAATAPIQAPAQTDPSVPFASGARSALAPTGNTAA